MTHRISTVDVRNMATKNLLRVVVALAFASPLGAQDDSSVVKPLVTIKELMEKTIAPATDTLWNVPESPTDEEWARLEEGAVTLLVATHVVGLGGTGPMDSDWVKQPAWRAFNRIMLDAGNASLAAIRARDVLALQKAGDVLYPPCEGCHAQFNPGVVELQ
jgi:hypothetical protein